MGKLRPTGGRNFFEVTEYNAINSSRFQGSGLQCWGSSDFLILIDPPLITHTSPLTHNPPPVIIMLRTLLPVWLGIGPEMHSCLHSPPQRLSLSFPIASAAAAARPVPSTLYPGITLHTGNPSTWEIEAGGSEFQGHLQVHS